MTFEPGYLILAIFISLGLGALLLKWQKPVLPRGYVVAAVLGSIFAVYYILNVMLGSGRTGWP